MPAAWSVRARGRRRRRVKQVVLAIDKFVASSPSSATAAAEEDAHTARLVLDVYVCILVYMQSSAS